MAKKSRISAATVSAASFGSTSNRLKEILHMVNSGRLMENLRAVNTHLVKDVTMFWKQIEEFNFQLSLIVDDDKDSIHDLELNVFKIVFSSRLSEAAERITVEMAAVTDWEKDLVNKTQLAIAEIKAVEMMILDLAKENDEKEKEIVELKEKIRSMEQGKESEKRWRKWLYPAAATATCLAATWVLFSFCKSNKK